MVSILTGVTVTTQTNTGVYLDENGEALRPSILWLDQRDTKLKSLSIILFSL